MEIKTYRAIIEINNEIITMIVKGRNRLYLKRSIIDFYKKINMIKDVKDIQIILVRVERYNGDYIEV